MAQSYFPWSWLKLYIIFYFHKAVNVLESVSECKPTKKIVSSHHPLRWGWF